MSFFIRFFEAIAGPSEQRFHNNGLFDPLTADLEHGNHPYIAMDDIDDPEFERQFYANFYNEARKYKYQDREDDGAPLHPSDFYYQMIAATGEQNSQWENLRVWWMLVEHPICQIILVTVRTTTDPNERKRWAHIHFRSSVTGDLIAYRDDQVEDCVLYVMEQCEKFQLPVAQPNQDILNANPNILKAEATDTNQQENKNVMLEISLDQEEETNKKSI